DLTITRFIKEVDKSIKVVFFGIHVTALDKECFQKHPYIDFIVRGEPEYTIRDLACAIRDKTPLSKVKGVTWKENKTIIKNEEREFIENLDQLPFPAWDDVNIDFYTMPISGEIFLLVMASRGCPHSCTFCAAHTLYGKKRRYRSAERIAEEITYNKNRFKVSSFLFWAEGFVAQKKKVFEVCDEIIKTDLKVRWVANSRADTVDLMLLKKMHEAGCWMIGYGIESGSQEILDRIKKGITLKQIKNAVKFAKQAHLKITAHVIIGIPGETKKHIIKTSNFVNKLGIDFLQLYCCVPFPGSPLYAQARKNNWIKNDNWEMFEQNFSILETPQISADEIMHLRKKLFRKFYINPRRAINIFKNLKTLNDLKNLLIIIKNIFKWI
ncbi:B12-binding domain-containing radical SAM protein, partial [Chlamydiota bacterium]